MDPKAFLKCAMSATEIKISAADMAKPFEAVGLDEIDVITIVLTCEDDFDIDIELDESWKCLDDILKTISRALAAVPKH